MQTVQCSHPRVFGYVSQFLSKIPFHSVQSILQKLSWALIEIASFVGFWMSSVSEGENEKDIF